MVNNTPANAGDIGDVSSMEIHSGILVWKIPWIDEPGGLQSMGSQKSQT